MSVKVFLEEIIIGMSILSKAGCFSMWVGIIPSVEGLKRIKRQRKGECALWLLEVWHWSSPAFIPGLISLVSQFSGFGFALELYHQLSWASAYRWQVVGFHSFHNCISQFFIINLLQYISLTRATVHWRKWNNHFQALLDTDSELTQIPGDPKRHCGPPVRIGAYTD